MEADFYVTEQCRVLFYVYGKHLRSCRDSQFLNHTVPRQASLRQFTSISLETDNYNIVLFGLRLYIPVNNFSVMSGCFAGLNQYY